MNKSVVRLAVVVPVYNEQAEVMGKVLEDLQNLHFDVIVVDDGSLFPVQVESPDFKNIIRHTKNKGQGAALNTGTMKAYQLGYDYCAHFDADGQHRADDLFSMLKEMQNGNADILLGSRFLRKETRQ